MGRSKIIPLYTLNVVNQSFKNLIIVFAYFYFLFIDFYAKYSHWKIFLEWMKYDAICRVSSDSSFLELSWF